MKIFRKLCKAAYRLRIAIRRHGDVDLRRPNIHPGNIWVSAKQQGRSCLLLALAFSRLGSLRIGFDHARRPRLCRTEYSPNRDRRTWLPGGRHHCLEHRVWDHARKRAPGGCTIGFSAYLPARMGPLILLQRSVPCLVSPAHRGLVC